MIAWLYRLFGLLPDLLVGTHVVFSHCIMRLMLFDESRLVDPCDCAVSVWMILVDPISGFKFDT